MVKTLSEFWNEVASICYDSSDYGIIAQVRSQFRTNEINKFVNAFIPGTEILKDGKNGTPVAMKGKADDDKGASGNEEIDFHGLQLFDYSDMKGDWMVVTFPNLEALEGYPAYYEETYGEPLDEERYEIMAAPDDVLARCELYTNLPADTLTLYNDLWTELGI